MYQMTHVAFVSNLQGTLGISYYGFRSRHRNIEYWQGNEFHLSPPPREPGTRNGAMMILLTDKSIAIPAPEDISILGSLDIQFFSFDGLCPNYGMIRGQMSSHLPAECGPHNGFPAAKALTLNSS
jgi:hypothetical protein